MSSKKERNVGKKKNTTYIDRESFWLPTTNKYGKTVFAGFLRKVKGLVERR